MVARFFIDLNHFARATLTKRDHTNIIALMSFQRDDLIIDIMVQTISIEKYVSLLRAVLNKADFHRMVILLRKHSFNA